MKIYLAGPMSGYPEHNVPAFDAARDALLAKGFEVVSPADITRQNPQTGIGADGSITPEAYQALVRLDLLAVLNGAEAVAVLRGWERSPGARREVLVAQAIGLPVYESDYLAKARQPEPLNDELVDAVAWFDSPENDRCESCNRWRDDDSGASDEDGIWVCTTCGSDVPAAAAEAGAQ